MNIKELIQRFYAMLQSMNEMSMAWSCKSANRCVWVENPSGHNNKYFKYLDGFTFGKAERCARISLLKPQYEKHRNFGGKKNWILTNKEKKELIDLMNQTNEKYNPCTNWQAVLITYNEDNFGITFKQTIENTFDKNQYPDAFTIDYKMPNYMEL